MSDPAIAQVASAKSSALSLKELAIVVLIGVAVGAAFEAIHPNSTKAERAAEATAAPSSEAFDPL